MKKQLNKAQLENTNGGLSVFATTVYAMIYKNILIEKGKDEAEKYLRYLDVSNDSKRDIRRYALDERK